MNLLNAYDQYGDFSINNYFTIHYNALASSMRLEFPLAHNLNNYKSIEQFIDFKKFSFEPIIIDWTIEDANNPDPNNDYPCYSVFKSKNDPVLIFIKLYTEGVIEVGFVYDVAFPNLENWIKSECNRLREKFAEKRNPKFNVLSKSREQYSTEEVGTLDFKSTDIKSYYNDDFIEIDGIITSSLNKRSSGLILLYGMPGTGKTTYIKHLISSFKDIKFIFIQNEFVNELLTPSFVSFLLKHRDSVLIIEDAEKIIVTRENDYEKSVVSTILQLTDGLFSDFLNIKIICTFNTEIDNIDKALLRKGRMIAKYEFQNLCIEKTNNILKTLNAISSDKPLSLAEIFYFDRNEFKNKEKKRIGF